MRSVPPRAARTPRAWLLALLLAIVVSASACADPPDKEMDQAQGAIDAARAAGADRYASEQYEAATRALLLARDAVEDGDYRLALNHALESREFAQNAAREAADSRARIRSEVERTMATLEMRIAEAHATLEASGSRVPRRVRDSAQQDLARLRSDVQEVGAAIAEGDYLAAQALLAGKREEFDRVLAGISEAAGAQSPQRQ